MRPRGLTTAHTSVLHAALITRPNHPHKRIQKHRRTQSFPTPRVTNLLGFSAPVFGTKIKPVFWARNRAQILGTDPCPDSGRGIAPGFQAKHRFQRSVQVYQFVINLYTTCDLRLEVGRASVPRIWAGFHAQNLGALLCPESGHSSLPRKRA